MKPTSPDPGKADRGPRLSIHQFQLRVAGPLRGSGDKYDSEWKELSMSFTVFPSGFYVIESIVRM